MRSGALASLLAAASGQRIENFASGPQRGSNGGTTKLPPGKQWVSHNGAKARARRVRQMARDAERKAKGEVCR